MKKTFLLTVIAVIVAACGGAGSSPKLVVTMDGKATTLDLKEGVILTSFGHAGDDQKWQELTVNLPTYEVKNSSDIARSMNAPGEAMVQLALIGRQGTDAATPMEKNNYPGYDPDNKASHFGAAYLKMNVEGKQITKNPIDFQGGKWEGSVKFSDVTGDTVKGEVDIKYGDKISIKGNFNAKVKGKEF